MATELCITRKMQRIIRQLKTKIRRNKLWLDGAKRQLKRQSECIKQSYINNELYGMRSRYALSVHKTNAPVLFNAIACTTLHFPYYPYECA